MSLLNGMKEKWKDIKGYEKMYQISSLGRVRSLNRITFRGRVPRQLKGRAMSIGHYGNGYCRVGLFKNKVCQEFLLHRLVAIHFLENKGNLPEVNHKDGNKDNNKVTNLEWCTSSYNKKHAFRIGLSKQLRGALHPKSRLTAVERFKLKSMYPQYSTRQLAKIFSIGRTTVSKILKSEE